MCPMIDQARVYPSHMYTYTVHSYLCTYAHANSDKHIRTYIELKISHHFWIVVQQNYLESKLMKLSKKDGSLYFVAQLSVKLLSHWQRLFFGGGEYLCISQTVFGPTFRAQTVPLFHKLCGLSMCSSEILSLPFFFWKSSSLVFSNQVHFGRRCNLTPMYLDLVVHL